MKGKSTTVRVSHETKMVLEDMASRPCRPLTAVISEAVEHYRRRTLLDTMNDSFLRLKQDRKESREAARQIQELEGALMDGLEEGWAWHRHPAVRPGWSSSAPPEAADSEAEGPRWSFPSTN